MCFGTASHVVRVVQLCSTIVTVCDGFYASKRQIKQAKSSQEHPVHFRETNMWTRSYSPHLCMVILWKICLEVQLTWLFSWWFFNLCRGLWLQNKDWSQQRGYLSCALILPQICVLQLRYACSHTGQRRYLGKGNGHNSKGCHCS